MIRGRQTRRDRKSTRLNSSHMSISYAVFCLKKKKRLAKDDSMDELSRVQCIRKLLGMNRARGVEASGFLIADYRVGTDIRVAEYSFLSAFDRQRAIAALKRMATEAHNSDLTRAVASIVLCRDEADEGVMALAELSRDRQVSGFHRVYHFSFPWVRADLANKMA